jgi:OOP family OmpA-OmpF porin
MKAVLKQFAVAVAAAVSCQLLSQNLVVNPGFEQSGAATDLAWLFGGDMFKSFDVKGWSQSTSGSSDFFLQGSTNTTNIPLYGGAMTSPLNGRAFAGFIPWCPDKEYREYLTGELTIPLEKGKKYIFRMKVSTGNKNAFLVNDLGVYFTKERFSDQTTNLPLRDKPQIWLDATSLQTNPEQWTIIESVFVAQGGERYFTFGNFLSDSATAVFTRSTTFPRCDYSYYYADDVVVEPSNQEPVQQLPPTAISDQIQAGKTFIARGINFDLDQSTLRPESYIQLHEIAAELKRKPTLQIDIRGYTDSSGNEAHNIQLSKSRAKVVADYLVSIGIDRSRITFGGYGSAEPISSLEPALNRRVEFVFR